jgi:type VI secretion system (T6SS) effector TldE1-like protein
MSTSRVALVGCNRGSRKAKSSGLFGGVAIACLIAGCGWTIYNNILGSSVYPTLGSASYDAPVVKRPPMVASRNAAQAVSDVFAALPQQSSIAEKPAQQQVAAITPSMFNERFGAASAQGVESNAAAAAPAPEPLKLAEVKDAPKSVAATKLAETKSSDTKSRSAPNTQVALNTPGPAREPDAAPAKSSGLSIRDMAERAKAAVMSITTSDRKSIVDKLWGKPGQGSSMLAYASADASVTGSIGRPQNPALGGSPPYDRDTAVYDISAHTVYLPDGTKLDAHSGLGSNLDDPRSARVRMRGVTPPHIYELKPREALFHGVPALRLLPIGGEDAIYGRDGLLAHTFMLGPNGDSNGCVSFRDYNAFLNAYRNGGIRKLAVLSRID